MRYLESGTFSNSSVRASTASRKALPGLKCGTRFSGIATLSPDRGLRPIRGGRQLIEKLPKPLISIRFPRTKVSPIASRSVLTACSASRCVSWLNRAASSSTKSLRVIRIYLVGDRTHERQTASGGLSRKITWIRCCPAWRATGRPGWSGRRFRAMTAGSALPWLLAGRHCPWP